MDIGGVGCESEKLMKRDHVCLGFLALAEMNLQGPHKVNSTRPLFLYNPSAR